MRVTSIDWSIDNDEVLEKLNYMEKEDIIKILKISEIDYKDMVEKGTLNDFVLDKIHHLPVLADEIMELPEEFNIPDDLEGDEEITNYITDTYGTFINGYTLDTDKGIELD